MTSTPIAIRQNIAKLTPYQSARKIGGQGTIWLNANEYAHAPSETVFGVDFGTLDIYTALNRYPEPQPQALIARYADYAGVKPENVLATRGGDEGIELIMRTFCENDEAILYCPPTYGMYGVSSQTLGLTQITIPQRYQAGKFSLDLDAIKEALDTTDAIKVLFVCNPNNPTGTLVDEIETLLAMTSGRAIVVVDEAYIEFCMAKSMASQLDKYPHLVIIRTLSKAFGLAGIRCGFVLANANVISSLAKVIVPYPIPVPTALIATHALSHDNIAVMKQRVANLIDERNKLAGALTALPVVVQVFESHANYLLIEFTDGEAVFEALWQAGMILRNQHHACHLANRVRMTIGSADENQAVLDFLGQLAQNRTQI